MSFWRKLLGLESKPKQVVVACSMCGQKNRLYQREHSGIYRCGSCQSPLAAPFTYKIGSEVISDYAPWGKPSANNEIAMALEKLAKRAWTFDTSDESGDFLFTPPSLLTNDGSVLNQGLSALYRHARRWAPGLDIPFRVPRVRVVSAMSSAGRFQVDEDGWTSIDLGSEFLLVPKAAWLIMAHEVCHHILAQSGEALRNDTRLNERITDVAMFVCGFGDLAKSGQTFVEATGSGYVRHHFGYLDASEYSFVHNWVIAARCANKLPGMENAKPLHPELAAGFQIKSRAVVALELLRSRIIDAGARERLLTHYRENYPLDKEEELVTRILEDYERDRR